MKNREYTIINVYTQENGEKIAVSMLYTYKGHYGTIKPTAEIEKYGKIEGEINSYWGKLPVVLVPVEQFAALKKEYDIIDFRGPVDRTRIRESKPRPDAMALKLYKVFAADAAAPQVDADGHPVEITVDGYCFLSGNGENLLKALKREYNFTKSDIAAAYALELDAAADAAEQPAAPVVEDIAAAVDAHFADMVANAPAADEQLADPSIKNTATPSRQKKQLAAWRGAVVEVLEIRAVNNTAIIKFKGGAITSAPADELESTTAKKTALPDWVKPGAVVNLHSALDPDKEPGRYTIESVKNTTIYYIEGYKSMINYFMHYAEPAPAADAEPIPAVDDAPAVTDADVLAAADRIKSNYEAMMQQAAADAAPAPRHRRNLNIAPRLSRWLHPARWVAAAYIVCLLSGLLLGVNTSTAVTDADAAADDIAAVYDLSPVTVTAAAVTDAPAAPSPVKKLAAPSPVKKAAADAVTLPGQKTASDIATATAPAADDAVTPSNQKTASDIAAVTDATAAADADGLTICAGTAWAYEMMHWA